MQEICDISWNLPLCHETLQYINELVIRGIVMSFNFVLFPRDQCTFYIPMPEILFFDETKLPLLILMRNSFRNHLNLRTYIIWCFLKFSFTWWCSYFINCATFDCFFIGHSNNQHYFNVWCWLVVWQYYLAHLKPMKF